MSKSLFCLLIVLLVLGHVAAQEQTHHTVYHHQTGMVRFIGTSSPLYIAPDLRGVDRANAILTTFAPQFGVYQQDLVLKRESANGSHLNYRYRQFYQGVPVWGGEIVLNMTADGGLISMHGEASPYLSLSVMPQVDAANVTANAINVIARRNQVETTRLNVTTPELWIYDARLIGTANRPAELAWKFEVSADGFHQVVFASAVTGDLLLTYSNIHTAQRVPGVANLATYDANQKIHENDLPGTLICDEGSLNCTNGADPDADAAHRFAKEVYDFYYTRFNRDSLDNAGLEIVSSVHYGVGECNAFWMSELQQMAYGDGCAPFVSSPNTSIVVDDIVGHELTHGVTDFTSDLQYLSQSGAINEALSDIFGEIYDLTNGTAEDIPANRWRIGEELSFNGQAEPGIRYMKNPTLFNEPDSINSPLYYHGSADQFGVHINSGVANKAAYLMADGDTFNGFTISGIGLDKSAAIWYEAQTNYLTTSSDYLDLYDFLKQSCANLIGGIQGITSLDCAEVDKAAQATQMNEPAIPAPGPDVPLCDTGVPEILFRENFEGETVSFSASATTGTRNAWVLQQATNPIEGLYSLNGQNLAAVSDSSAEMKGSVTLPAGAYLHFTHNFRFEGFNYDGGVVEYSINNGETWTRVTDTTFATTGRTYNGFINNTFDNPLAGQQGFVDFGSVGDTRYNLSSLAGQNARFRFRVASDGAYDDIGWWIDNVQIYTCSGTGNLLVNGGFESGPRKLPNSWTVAQVVDDKQVCNGLNIVAHSGSCAFRFKGNPLVTTRLKQKIDPVPFVTGNTTVNFSAWVNNKTATVVKFKVIAFYSDINMPPSRLIVTHKKKTNGYIQHSDSLTLEGTPVRIKFQIQYRGTTGKLFVDDIALTMGSGR